MAGLVSVVKDFTTNVNHVTQTVSETAQVVPATHNQDNTQGLCMPSMQLPSFHRCMIIHKNKLCSCYLIAYWMAYALHG